MAAPAAYRSKSVSVFGNALTGITDAQIGWSGSGTDLTADASKSVLAVFVDQIVADVTVTTTDVGAVTTLLPGSTGALIVVFELRAEGSGAGTPTKTATMPNSTLMSITPNYSTNGIGSVSLVFRVSDPDGGASQVVWT